MRGQYDGYREIDGVAPGLAHRDLRRAAAGDRELALGRRAVLHPHRQAPAGQETEVRLVFKHPPRLRVHPEHAAAARSRARSCSRSTRAPASGWSSTPTAPTARAPARSSSTWSSPRRAARTRPRTRCCCTPRSSATAPLHAPGQRRGDLAGRRSRCSTRPPPVTPYEPGSWGPPEARAAGQRLRRLARAWLPELHRERRPAAQRRSGDGGARRLGAAAHRAPTQIAAPSSASSSACSRRPCARRGSSAPSRSRRSPASSCAARSRRPTRRGSPPAASLSSPSAVAGSAVASSRRSQRAAGTAPARRPPSPAASRDLLGGRLEPLDLLDDHARPPLVLVVDPAPDEHDRVVDAARRALARACCRRPPARPIPRGRRASRTSSGRPSWSGSAWPG